MSLIILNVDEVRRTLSASGGAFVVHDKEVDIVRFALNTGFTDVVLDEHSALRVMYQRPGETEARAQTLTYYDTDGLRNYYDWQLLSSDLAEKGTLTVALCILRTDGDVEEWHTTPCQVRVLDTIHTDDSDEGDETITPTVAQRVAVLETMIQRVASGTPIVVASTSAMTDTSQIYVLSTDGYWYYYDGTTWVSGGEYGAVATDTTLTQSGVPADAKAVGDAVEMLEMSLDDIEGNPEKVTLSLTADGDNASTYNRNLYADLTVKEGETYTLDFSFNQVSFKDRSTGSKLVFEVATATQASYNYLVDTITLVSETYSADKAHFSFTATGNASKLYVYCYTKLSTPIDITVVAKNIRTLAEIDTLSGEIGTSIFGNQSLVLNPTYDYSSRSKPLGTYTLTAGRYVLTYFLEEGAKPTSLNSRCTPWYSDANGTNIFARDVSGVEYDAGMKYWVFDISEDGEYTFYFWYKFTELIGGSTAAHISNIQLFDVSTIKGALSENTEIRDTLEEIPYSYISQFQRIGCIGDSWTAGSIYESDSVWAGTLGNLSWCKNAERFTGSQFIQYAKGGLSARTWLTDIHGKVALENTEPCSLYIVNLGINDATEITNGTIALGQVDDFENEATGTFFYYYGAVVDCIKNHAPSAKIILETILMRSEQQVNVANAIIEYASHYDIPYVSMYADAFYRSSSMTLVGGHPTAAAHAGMAMANLRLFSKCIKDNPDYFKVSTQNEYGDFSLLGIADSIGKNYISSPAVYHREAETSHDALTYNLCGIKLTAGKYIFKWSQTSATKINSDSRCTPVMVINDVRSYFSGSNFSNSAAGTYRWVLTIAEDCKASFYYWSKGLVEAFTARDFDLYAYDSIRGRMDRLEGLVE